MSVEEEDSILPTLTGLEKPPLSCISEEEFRDKQKVCSSLKDSWEKTKTCLDKEFKIKKDRLVRFSNSKRGMDKVQICILEIHRSDILKLCHDGVSEHLGSCKTEDRVLANFIYLFFLAKLFSTDRRVCKNV